MKYHAQSAPCRGTLTIVRSWPNRSPACARLHIRWCPAVAIISLPLSMAMKPMAATRLRGQREQSSVADAMPVMLRRRACHGDLLMKLAPALLLHWSAYFWR